MLTGSNRYTAWTQDRFTLFLVLATAVHLVLMFGISFGVHMKPIPRLADTLDVVLVQWRSEAEPEDADYLAQANQKGGGVNVEAERPSAQQSAAVPAEQQGEDAVNSPQQTPQAAVELREIIAAEAAADELVQINEVEQPDSPQPDASRLMQQSMNMASLQPELRRENQWKSKIPRREFISANTREYEFASYMSAWVSKVERIGNLNYPTELRRKKLHGDLVLTVGINANGTVESIAVKRSSGINEVDNAAVNIVQLAAPYSPLPENITKRVDILHITRTWRFETGFGVE